MSVALSNTLTQSADGMTLTYTDTSTGLVSPITRSLVVRNSDGDVYDTPVFSGTVAVVTITKDMYLSFVETITDANGTYTQTENYLSTAFFELAFAPAVAAVTSPCDDIYLTLFNLNSAESYKEAAVIFGIHGVAVSAQACIDQANFLTLTPYYA